MIEPHLGVPCAVEQRVDERLGLVTGLEASSLHVGCVDITLDDFFCVGSVVLEEVRQTAKFETGQVGSD